MEYFLALIAVIASFYGVDAGLVACVIQGESSWDPNAIGRAGEIGLGQILPETGEWLAQKASNDQTLYHPIQMPLDLRDPYTNIVLTVYGLDRWPWFWSTYDRCSSLTGG